MRDVLLPLIGVVIFVVLPIAALWEAKRRRKR